MPTTNGLNGSTTTAESDEDDFDPRAEEKKPPTFTVGPAPEINGFSSPPPLGEFHIILAHLFYGVCYGSVLLPWWNLATVVFGMSNGVCSLL